MDFYKINAFEKGVHNSFDELLKVLVIREKPDGAIEYQPNDSDGGDGGVEALWLLKDGSKICYQAKFFENKKLDDPQLRQMDKSFTRALETHPDLVKYVFVLPFDLKPDRGPNVQAQSQRQKWKNHVRKWKQLARKKSINVDFEIWGSTELTSKLTKNENKYLCEHWFGEKILDSSWFKNQVSSSIAKLDDRFNPDDHVEVDIQNLFDTIVRGPVIQKRIETKFRDLKKYSLSDVNFKEIGIDPDQNSLEAMSSTWEKIVSMESDVRSRLDTPWRWLKILDDIKQFHQMLNEIDNQIYSRRIGTKNLEEKELNKIKNVLSVLHDIIEIFRDKNLEAEEKQCAFVFGEAGSGKSHIFAETASSRVKQGLPTVLILGQDIGNGPFWRQFADLLGIKSNDNDDILGLLNTAGERQGKRTLILFDAINEGAGSHYWRNWLPDVVSSVQSYPFLAIAFSCRNVYAKHIIPKSLLDNHHDYWVRGFFTLEEMEHAANRYLDMKGISRPNTPSLSPEFSNPLFLKVTSEYLKDKGEIEFPRGLHGIKKFISLYIDSFISRVNMQNLDAEDLSGPLKKLIQEMSKKMALDRCDFITIDFANQIVKENFKDRTPPEGKSWLDVFIQAGFFRRDPPPLIDVSDPLNQSSELIRFSFQRFQDFLVADALVDEIDKMKSSGNDISNGFVKSGPLRFLFYDDNIDGYLRYEFAGLIEALSTIYPERLDVEFAKSLPKWEKHWVKSDLLRTTFAESFKWRQLDAFNKESRELLSKLDQNGIQLLKLLLEVSITIGHPYNATWLHELLNGYELAERDSYWTHWVNNPFEEKSRQIDRIISWSLSGLDGRADQKHIELATIVLVWSLSSSDNKLRDHATKALTSLFLKHARSFNIILEKMKDCNDPYVIERMYAAAFGACCLDPSQTRLSGYSELVYNVVFASGEPPVALLTRDYALGIIEIANYEGSTGPSVDLNKCYHPFSSEAPQFDINKDDIEKIAKTGGNEKIFYMISSPTNDFGKNDIPLRVGDFLLTPLSEVAPKSRKETKEICYEQVISICQNRIDVLESYEDNCRVFQIIEMTIGEKETYNRIKKESQSSDNCLSKESDLPDPLLELCAKITKSGLTIDKAKKQMQDSLKKLKSLMSDDEYQRICKEYFKTGSDYEHIDVEQCKLWIVKRSYELGWTEKLFPKNTHSYNHQNYSNRVGLEPVDKKYQQIALEELQARLADNYWLLYDCTDKPVKYRYSHRDFKRNLEPTILPANPVLAVEQSTQNNWIIKPEIKLPDLSEEELQDWVDQSESELSIDEFIYRYDNKGQKWNLLYEFVEAKSRYDKETTWHDLKMKEERYSLFGLVPIDKVDQLSDFLHKCEQGKIMWDIDYYTYTDGPFLGEAFWRNTWEAKKKIDYISDTPFVIPVASYLWENHLDKTLPDGLSTCLPERWFAEEFKLKTKPGDFLTWYDKTDNEIFKIFKNDTSQQCSVVIGTSALEEYLTSTKMTLLSFSRITRTVWHQSDNNKMHRRDTYKTLLDGEEI